MWDSAALDNSNVGNFAGGFLNNTNNFQSPSKAQDEKKRTDRITNIVPCTIAQILQIPESEEHLKVGPLPAHIITVVGVVQAVDRQSTKITYMIDDLSGKPIEAQLWVGGTNDETAMEAAQIVERSYVRVTGALRVMKGKRHIIVFKIRPITDFNELTMHLIEIIHTSMSAALMSNQSASDSMTNAGNMTFANVGNVGTSFSNNPTSGAPSMQASAYPAYGLSRPQQLVLQAILACKDEEGANVKAIIANELKNLEIKVIMNAVEFLSNEGHIYSTIDDDHYKSTDCP